MSGSGSADREPAPATSSELESDGDEGLADFFDEFWLGEIDHDSVVISTMFGQTKLVVPVPADTTVGHIKHTIEEETSIPQSAYNFMWRYRVLNDEKTLSEYGLVSGQSEVRFGVCLKLHGGGGVKKTIAKAAKVKDAKTLVKQHACEQTREMLAKLASEVTSAEA